jgi:type II restriction enzyme
MVDLGLDQSLVAGYKSRSQIARILTENWVERQLYCPSCRATELKPTPQNTKSRDFNCENCSEPYELKSRSSPFHSRVLNGEYRTMLATIRESRTPNLLLLEYDSPAYAVRNLIVVHRSLINASAIVARQSPLSASAQRHGWLGCYIDLSQIPSTARLQIVRAGVVSPPESIQAAWQSFRFAVDMTPAKRGWLADVLSCVETLSDRTFDLDDVYRFEGRLGGLHPANRNVRPKIRQQLQILVGVGLIERVEPGKYRRAASPRGH